MKNDPRPFWQSVVLISIFISAVAFYQTLPQLELRQIAIWHSKWAILLILFLLNIILGGLAILGLRRGLFDSLLQQIESASVSGPWRAVAVPGILLLLAAFWYIRLKIFGEILPQLFPSLWILLWLSLASAAIFKAFTGRSWLTAFAAVILIQGVLFRIWGLLNEVTDFPFTLEYSETSRFYYGSLPFSKSIYGLDLPLSTLHPSRYLLQSIPFFLPGLPLWAHRLWQALLWIFLTGISAWLLSRRLKFHHKGLTLLVAAWAFVYFLQGAVYYHLHVCIIIVLLGVSVDRPWRSFFAVLVASLWAGISRVNWFPVPAMLAVAIYLLEEPFSPSNNFWRYLSRPILWTISGVSAALASQALYILWSGNSSNIGDFGTSFTSDLIWSRLLPNLTYPLGVIPGILIVSFPLLVSLVYYLAGRRGNWHFIRPLGLFTMLGALFAGGLVVSTKIGGGGDIHNMDAYMVMLAVLTTSFFAGRVKVDKQGAVWGNAPVWPLVLAVFIPVVFSVQSVQPRMSYDRVQAEKDLVLLKGIVSKATADGGEVLFISERHLVTFHMIGDVSLVPDYEVVTLMEMAMSGNKTYLERFNKDLANHRFKVIISRKQRVVKKDDEPFAEENNVWIDSISRPLLCYYQRSVTLESSNTLILVSSQTAGDCP